MAVPVPRSENHYSYSDHWLPGLRPPDERPRSTFKARFVDEEFSKGSDFLGSKDFPKGLIQAVEKYDPAGLLLGDVASRSEDLYSREPSVMERRGLVPIMKSTLQGKRVLNMAGGADKLVPTNAQNHSCAGSRTLLLPTDGSKKAGWC